jgi:hypothetical protein
MLVFVKGNDKVYDGNTTATLSFNGDPTVGGTKAVTLGTGTATFADKNVASNILITHTGYTLTGAEAAEFALWQSCLNPANGTTSAAITPAALTVTANNNTKVYGQTFAPAGTAFTSTPLVNAETIGSVTETSTGSVATAPVAGSPYAITPSDATGGTFTPTNYTITYVNGALTVTPVEVTPVAAPPVVTPTAEVPLFAQVARAPVVTPPTKPPELLTLVTPTPIVLQPTPVPLPDTVPLPLPVLVVVPKPIVDPVAPPPKIYVRPVRLRKQDRN